MAARPQVTVQNASSPTQLVMPAVFVAPIRDDIVQFVHTSMNKNNRQAYSVKRRGKGHDGKDAGMQHSAISWGTGRAVARVARVQGGGTSRSGQGAFGNMCRSGRMFAPTRTWRKWHRKINTNQKRYAVASALAASALPSLVMARGHSVAAVPEIPLVLDASVESIAKTKEAIKVLTAVGAYADVEKAAASRQIRTGKGKMRNRRHTARRGPLVVYNTDNGLTRAFRNLPGVELSHVSRLNLLQLAPGGHVGRFIVWTADAFKALNGIWGSTTRESTQKKGYKLPRPVMINSDLTRIINSDEVQSKVNPAQNKNQKARRKKNPLKNFGVMVRLNPYALAMKRAAVQKTLRAKAGKESGNEKTAAASHKKHAKAHVATQKATYARISRD